MGHPRTLPRGSLQPFEVGPGALGDELDSSVIAVRHPAVEA